MTVSGSDHDGVREIEIGTTVGELAEETGAGRGADDLQAVLLGGYFGGWLATDRGWNVPLDPITLRDAGSAFGAGVVAFLGNDRCGVRATARIMDWMAGQSAAQCGPCVFGLRAIADATGRIAAGRPERDDLERIERWSRQLAGRGACRHPDGAVGQLWSSLRVFGPEWELHQRRGTCSRERFEDDRTVGGPGRRVA
jgi:NADH:ubiquinone oxidoreductase subunit F (NADH-binding)